MPRYDYAVSRDVWEIFKPFIRIDEDRKSIDRAKIDLTPDGGTIIAVDTHHNNPALIAETFTARLSVDDVTAIWGKLYDRYDLPLMPVEVSILLDAEDNPKFTIQMTPYEIKEEAISTTIRNETKMI